MNKTWIIMKNELITLLSRRSFWLTTLGLPIIASLVFGVIWRVNQSSIGSLAMGQLLSGPQDLRPEGYVDQAGLIQALPDSIPTGQLLPFQNEASARQALQAGKISAFFIVPQDYLSSGKVFYVRPDFNPMASEGGRSGQFLWALHANLVGGDSVFANLVNGPLELEDTSLAVVKERSVEDINTAGYWVPYGVTMLFYFLIFGSASLLLGNITKEKENRVMETLLTSSTPLQLLTGKVIGLGLVGLLQTILWLGTGYTLLSLSGRAFDLSAVMSLPPSILAWGIVFFLLGYAVYASLMAGLGALAPNLREASQVTFVIMLPLIVPVFFSSSVFLSDPNGPIATGLSLFPLSAPVAMMARLSASPVPWWQPYLSALLVAGTALLVVRASARMFHAQALLSGQPVKVDRYLRALVGKG